MRMHLIAVAGALIALTGATFQARAADAEPHWPQWRGPLATGEAPHANPPVTWSAKENLAWKAELPGSGSATPIIVGDLVLVQTAVPTEQVASGDQTDARPQRQQPPQQRQAQRPRRGQRPAPGRGGRGGFRGGRPGGGERPVHQFTVIAFDRHTGDTRWETVVHEQAPGAGVRQGHATYASNSPVSDGRHIWAYFGSYGLHCLDLDGNVLWSKQFGPMSKRGEFGEGSSPALHGDRIVIVRDHEGDSNIVTLDAATGDVIWTRDRDESSSWATPLILDVDGRPQVIVPATGASRAYDLETGDMLWSATGMTTNAIPSPVHADGLVYLTSGYRGEALQAIRPDRASGNIDGSGAIAWEHNHRTPYVPSPLLYDGAIYFIASNSGIVSALDAATGEPWYVTERLPLSTVYASPVAAAGRVYISGRDGGTVVLRHGEAFEVLAVNQLDDTFDASPAIAGNQLFLRGERHLYCIQEPQ